MMSGDTDVTVGDVIENKCAKQGDFYVCEREGQAFSVPSDAEDLMDVPATEDNVDKLFEHEAERL